MVLGAQIKGFLFLGEHTGIVIVETEENKKKAFCRAMTNTGINIYFDCIYIAEHGELIDWRCAELLIMWNKKGRVTPDGIDYLLKEKK